MVSFPRPLASALASSSSSSATFFRSTLAFRSFASSSLAQSSYKERENSIREAEEAASKQSSQNKKSFAQQSAQWGQNAQNRTSMSNLPSSFLLYSNLPPSPPLWRWLPGQWKLEGVSRFRLLQMQIGLFYQMALPQHQVEFQYPSSRLWYKPRTIWEVVQRAVGQGPWVAAERALVKKLERVYVSFKRAELRGDTEELPRTSEAPILNKTLRHIRLKPRSERIKASTWEIARHVKEPKLVSLIRVPFLGGKATVSHALVRFETVQRFTLPPKAGSTEKLVREFDPRIENVLFERRDWLEEGGAIPNALPNTTLLSGSSIVAPWKVKAFVGYDDLEDVDEIAKQLTQKEMDGFGHE